MLQTQAAAAAPIDAARLLEACESECPDADVCVVAGGDAAAFSGADRWNSGGVRAMCVAAAGDELVASEKRAVALTRRRSRAVALGLDSSRYWRHAETLSVEGADASAIAQQLASFAELSTLSLRNASLAAFPAQIFSLSALHRLDLRANSFSRPARLSESERRFLAQLDSLALDESALDTHCADPQPIREHYAACSRHLAIQNAWGTSGSSDRVHAGHGSAAVDKALLLFVSTGSAGASSTSSSSASSDGETSVDTLTWVVVGSVISLVCLICLVAYCYTKCDRWREQGDKGDDDVSDTGATEAESLPARLRFLPFRSKRRRSRVQSASKWHDDPELRRWAIDPSAVVPLRQIGSGAFSTVWLAQYMNELVALKRFLPVTARSSAGADDQRDFHAAFASELTLLATLVHPKIVALVGVVYVPPPLSALVDVSADDRGQLGLALEYMERGDLRALLTATKESGAGSGWSRRKLAIAADVAEAIAYLHAQTPPVLHRDVTSRNILLDANYTAKLADFGLSRRLRVGGGAQGGGAQGGGAQGGGAQGGGALAMTRGVGTSRWIAPEVLTGDGAYSPAVDVYSFGVVLAELDRHEPPFCAVSLSNGRPLSDAAVLELLRAGAIEPEVSDGCPRPVAALMLECLAADPRERPVAAYAASRLRAMLERLRRVSDVGDDIANADSVADLGVDGGGGAASSGLALGVHMADSFFGADGASASASSDSVAASQYSLMQDSG